MPERPGTRRLRDSVVVALSFVLLVMPPRAPLASVVRNLPDLAEVV
jgi:hypothetical protein